MGQEKTTRSKYKWIAFVKALVLVATLWLIFGKLSNKDSLGQGLIEALAKIMDYSTLGILSLVVILMPLNWFLEAEKWKLLARPISEITLKEAFGGVLAGLTLGFVTPQAVGDYAGRLLSIKGENKGKLIGNVWLGNATQMSVTILFGAVGVWIFIQSSELQFSLINSFWWIGVLLIIAVIAILYTSKVKIFGERLVYYFDLVGKYPTKDYIFLFLLSLSRYLVFSFQFYLILNLFKIPLSPLTLFGGISWMFLIKSIVPSFNFMSDLGVRELSVLTFFEVYQVSQPAVLASSLLLWMINILIPVLIGLYFMIRLKVNSNR
jgi:uncharacterized membrane protein YbhN (UPF0104 family)